MRVKVARGGGGRRSQGRRIRPIPFTSEHLEVMAGLVPRLSGTSFAYAASLCFWFSARAMRRRCAARVARCSNWNFGLVRRRCWRWFEQVCDGPPLHQVGSDQPREREWALDDFVGVIGQAQQHEGDHRDGDLDADGIFRVPQEVADFQGLLDPSKKQFDGPSTLIEVGDLLRAGLQVVCKDAQNLAGLNLDPDFAHQLRHRVTAGCGQAFGKMPGAIAEDRRSRRNRPIFLDEKGRIGFQARDDTASRLIELRPPAEIVIAEVEHISRPRFDRHRLGGGDIIDVWRRHHQVKRLVGIGIIDNMRFGAANAGRKRRPFAAHLAQLHAGRIDQTHAIADFPPVAGLQQIHQGRQQAAKDFDRTIRISRRQRRPRHRAAPKMIKLAGVAFQVGFNFAQTPRSAKLTVQHGDQMRLGLDDANVQIGIVLLDQPFKNRPRNLFQKVMKDDILMLHGVVSFFGSR